jgi:hypothetical protein
VVLLLLLLVHLRYKSTSERGIRNLQYKYSPTALAGSVQLKLRCDVGVIIYELHQYLRHLFE